MTSTKTRAPKGGIMVNGVFYKGGWFLPTSEPQRGKWNTGNKKTTKKARKVEVAPYTWEYAPDGMRSIFSYVAGTVATMDGEIMVYCGNAKTLAFRGMTEDYVKALVEKYNSGERFIAA